MRITAAFPTRLCIRASPASVCPRRVTRTYRSCVKSTERIQNEDYEAGFSAKYAKAMTMSELYSVDRPPPIPIAEHEQRQKRKDTAEIIEAAARKGKSEAYVREQLQQLNALLPDLINLHKLKASDWVTVLSDVDSVAEKLVTFKSIFPGANAFKVVSRLPRMLLKPTDRVREDAEQSRQMLSSLSDPDSVIEAVPDLVDPLVLNRSLAAIQAAMPGQDAMQVLQQSPEVLYSIGGDADIEDSAEYGEISANF